MALGDTPTVFISIAIVLLTTFQYITGGSLKKHAVLGTAPVIISSKELVDAISDSEELVNTVSDQKGD